MAISKTALKEALTKSGGIHLQAAQALGVTRQAVSDRIARDPDLKKHCQALIDRVNDVAKAAVLGAMTDKDKRLAFRAGSWWLERRDPEFANQHRVANPDGSPLLDMEKLLDGLSEDAIAAFVALRSAGAAAAEPGPGPGAGRGAAAGPGEEEEGTGEA